MNLTCVDVELLHFHKMFLDRLRIAVYVGDAMIQHLMMIQKWTFVKLEIEIKILI